MTVLHKYSSLTKKKNPYKRQNVWYFLDSVMPTQIAVPSKKYMISVLQENTYIYKCRVQLMSKWSKKSY